MVDPTIKPLEPAYIQERIKAPRDFSELADSMSTRLRLIIEKVRQTRTSISVPDLKEVKGYHNWWEYAQRFRKFNSNGSLSRLAYDLDPKSDYSVWYGLCEVAGNLGAIAYLLDKESERPRFTWQNAQRALPQYDSSLRNLEGIIFEGQPKKEADTAR